VWVKQGKNVVWKITAPRETLWEGAQERPKMIPLRDTKKGGMGVITKGGQVRAWKGEGSEKLIW